MAAILIFHLYHTEGTQNYITGVEYVMRNWMVQPPARSDLVWLSYGTLKTYGGHLGFFQYRLMWIFLLLHFGQKVVTFWTNFHSCYILVTKLLHFGPSCYILVNCYKMGRNTPHCRNNVLIRLFLRTKVPVFNTRNILYTHTYLSWYGFIHWAI